MLQPKNVRRLRRAMAVALVLTGGVLMLLSPSVHTGLIPFGLGICLELVGHMLERRDPP